LNLNGSSLEITQIISDIYSVSGSEAELASEIYAALEPFGHLEVFRFENTIIAKTNLGLAKRVIIAGHIDTVPVNNNLPTKLLEVNGEEHLWGRGTVDMKAGCAVMLKLAAELKEPF